LRVLDEPAAESPLPQAVLAPAGPYGRVLEIVAPADAADGAAAALAALAPRLGALPWRTPGPQSILQRLRGLPLPEQAALAQRLAAMPGAADPAFLDVAACLAGIAPAWSGGPLSWAASEGTARPAA
jgi:3-hydroxyacyl-CoA dehydrogenase/enoyl-CoA hydratase/3-hydroxybutyryl-CoA epimerase